jgi:hypothetical protein
MKQIIHLALVSIILISVFSTGCSKDTSKVTAYPYCKPGNSWTHLETFSTEVGKNSVANSVGGDLNGNMYAVGYTADNLSKLYWTVRRSSNQGNDWVTVDSYRLGDVDSQARSITHDQKGNLYVVGEAGTNAIIRKSTDNGASWQTIENFRYKSNSYGAYYGISFDSSANLYVTGYANADSVDHWIVRRSKDLGTTWETVMDSTYNGRFSQGRAIVADKEGNVFTSGYEILNGAYRWVVWRSPDFGSNWIKIEDHALGPLQNAIGYGLALSSTGILYSVGAADNGGQPAQATWVTRKLDPPYTSAFNTLEEYNSLKGAEARGVFVDPWDHVYTIGLGRDANAYRHFQVRRFESNLNQWATVLDYQLAEGEHSWGRAVGMDTEGNIYAVGNGRTPFVNAATDPSTLLPVRQDFWITKRLNCQY